MPTQVSITAVANQGFSVKTSDDYRWTFKIYETTGCMCVDITRDDTTLIVGARLVAGTPVISYKRLMGDGPGNFLLLTADGEMPWWEKFGVTQFLYYYTLAELQAL